MFTVTFYSYKGGVGRTMALANIAHRLCARGKRVFILDFDLEAPGLDTFFRGDVGRPGLVEYVASYLEKGKVPALEEFVSEIKPVPGAGHRGGLFCMRAGRGDELYQERLARLNWKDFYAQNHGFLFVENLKGAIQSTYSPDYVLVDSRTGLTDVSGICTLQLPNLVVFVFALNDQNLEGTTKIYRSVVENKLNRPIDALLVASPVPDVPSYETLKAQRFAKARERLGRGIDVTLPFAPFAAFEETILAPRTGTHLGDAYDQLSEKILDLNKFDVLTLLKEARAVRKEGDPERAEAKYRQIIEAFPDNSSVWNNYGIFLRASRKPREASEAFQRALQLDGKVSNYAELASTLLAMGEDSAAQENFYKFLDHSSNLEQISTFTDLFDSYGKTQPAIAGYKRLIELSGDDSRAVGPLIQLGNIYMRLKNPGDAVGLYEKAQRLMPNELGVTFNLANALRLLGLTEAADLHFDRATQMYEQTQMLQTIPARRANAMQAMGVSYIALKNWDKAKSSLLGALEIAGKTGSPIFSAVQYRDIPSIEFKAETSELLERLEDVKAELNHADGGQPLGF